MPETAPPRGRVVWHELMTTDPEAAMGFYKRVVAWDETRFDQDPSYRMFTMRKSPMAGLMLLPDEARQMGSPPHWLLYVAVPDVDATVRQATGLGARTYVAPKDIPNVGRIAILADPQGATFALYKPTMAGAGSDEAGIGDFSWHELMTSDWKAAWEFYRALFGWEFASEMDMGGMGTYWMFKRGGGTTTLGGMFNVMPNMPSPPQWVAYIHVPDADAAAALATKNGGKLLNGPMEVPGGDRIAQLMDPQGAMFAVHSSPASRAASPPPARPVAKKTAAKKAAPKKTAPKKAAPKKKAAVRKALKKTAKRATKPMRSKPKKTAKRSAPRRAAAKRAKPKTARRGAKRRR